MGNANSTSVSSRDRHKSGDESFQGNLSPGIKDGQAFSFDKNSSTNPKILQLQASHEEDSEPYYTKAGLRQDSIDQDITAEDFKSGRLRSSTVSEGTKYGPGSTQPPNSSKILPTVFKWDGGGQNVFISGSFSNWKTIPMVKSHGDFVTIVDLPEGEHQYKFCIDGQWKLNPSEPTGESEIGSKNNVITVKKTDFEVFDALDVDSINSNLNKNNKYGQDIPSYKPWEKTAGPPILPPHLLQVILNKDTPLSCEPTLLPEPNHVMLNHLYALSIKDGVMVLSATHRYRKKYVTTLLYKPI